MHLVNRLLLPLSLKITRTSTVPSRPAIVPLERNTKATLNRLWDDEAFKARYRNAHEDLYGSLMKAVDDEGLLPPAKSVIDVGCGPGFFLELLHRRGFPGSLSGCDFSESALQTAARNCATAKYFLHDIYEPLPTRQDLLFCMETLEHLLYPGRALKHLLAAADVVVLTVPEGRRDSFPGHINFWSPESWEVFCQEHSVGRPLTTRLFNNDKNLMAVFRPS